jgi:hypothetical protein
VTTPPSRFANSGKDPDHVPSGDSLPATCTTPDLFLGAAERYPDHVAVEPNGGCGCVTYAELKRRSGWIANELRQRGIGPADLVTDSRQGGAGAGRSRPRRRRRAAPRRLEPNAVSGRAVTTSVTTCFS